MEQRHDSVGVVRTVAVEACRDRQIQESKRSRKMFDDDAKRLHRRVLITLTSGHISEPAMDAPPQQLLGAREMDERALSETPGLSEFTEATDFTVELEDGTVRNVSLDDAGLLE